MHLRSVIVPLILALAAPPGPARQSFGVSGEAEVQRLTEFLGWAHPAGDGCGPPAGIRIVEKWAGGLMARYDIPCGDTARRLQGVFETRERDGVWQVAGGFEAEPERLGAALDASRRKAAEGGLAPPAANPGTETGPETPLGLITPPQVTRDSRPEYPEEAGRARLIGEARVELLVQVPPSGEPLRTRPLRGPDPDLGMRRAASEAALRWRFLPARLRGLPVTSFTPIDLVFTGLPPESRNWIHRALFHVEAIVSEDRRVVDEARVRLEAGEAFEALASGPSVLGGGDWGFVSAATLPAAARKALHEAPVGGYAGPVSAEGLHYLFLKKGEIYYALRPRPDAETSYQIVHQRNAPPGEALRLAVEGDIADYLAETRRQSYVNEAARQMGMRQVRKEIGQLLVHTDVLDDREIDRLGQVVEAAVRAHEAFWSPLVPLRPFNQQVLVFAWARQGDHDRLHRLWAPGRKPEIWSYAGEYIPASRILSVPCEAMRGHLPIPILIHEAIHMLNYERTYQAGVRPSKWFEEGLATYFGYSQIGGQLSIEPGSIRRSGTIVAGDVMLQFDPRSPLNDYLKRIRDEGAIPLRPLLTARAGDPFWSGGRGDLAYNASWTLVHFLLHGDKGRYKAPFLEYARAEAAGEGGIETFAGLFGRDFAALETAWHRYEESL
ncbi:MAG TPA: hypothetical protein VGV60_09465 [Candidatus Polarisedimenticolia bacterium]|jgi:hypothetical protein|nr:hypothetical protein [Candidatus Polarisedimenticolia bacterium]